MPASKHAANIGIEHNGTLFERKGENGVGGIGADAGKGKQVFAIAGHRAVVISHNVARTFLESKSSARVAHAIPRDEDFCG